MYKKILDKMPENLKTCHKIIHIFDSIAWIVGCLLMFLGLVLGEEEPLWIGAIIAGAALLILIDYIIAVYFYGVALEKGYSDSVYLMMPFIVPPAGYVLIAALPDRKSKINETDNSQNISKNASDYKNNTAKADHVKTTSNVLSDQKKKNPKVNNTKNTPLASPHLENTAIEATDFEDDPADFSDDENVISNQDDYENEADPEDETSNEIRKLARGIIIGIIIFFLICVIFFL